MNLKSGMNSGEIFRELRANPDTWAALAGAAGETSITLVYGAKDVEHNNARCLAEFLNARGAPKARKKPFGRAATSGMNLVHRWLCNSALWQARVEERIIPWALAELELGKKVLEIGPGPGYDGCAAPTYRRFDLYRDRVYICRFARAANGGQECDRAVRRWRRRAAGER